MDLTHGVGARLRVAIALAVAVAAGSHCRATPATQGPDEAGAERARPEDAKMTKALPSAEELSRELAPQVLEGVTGDARTEGERLLTDLARDWLEEARVQAVVAHDVLRILRDDLIEATRGQGAAERLTVLRANLLDRRVGALSRRSFALGKQVVDGAVPDDEARREGRAILADVDVVAPLVRAIGDDRLRRPLDARLQDVMLEALYAVERRAMSLRLNRYASDQGKGKGSAPAPPVVH